VTQIPVFLMLRKLGLLNTFAALLLPGLASGYSIFLLKGFFDSLPQELYDSAALDGAGEWRIFWIITISLSKPVLAVIALEAFTAAYGNFLFALLICQDSKMWTLMVWLYQLQQRSGPGVICSSLLIAALPTLIVFVFAQRVIMQGLVVPIEK
jgi:multiple sugar transport system permease protein